MIPYNAIDTTDAEDIMPWTNIGVIVLNFLFFFYELIVNASGGDNALSAFIQNYGLVPCEYTAQCAIGAGAPTPLWITLFTSMFLHGGWAHILGNMVYLFVFGNHVERSMGHARYLAFYLLWDWAQTLSKLQQRWVPMCRVWARAVQSLECWVRSWCSIRQAASER
jgi:membrane associated rhomboid family serine protease